MSTYKSSMTTASWKSCRLKDFCEKRTMKNTDRKYCSVFTNSAVYGIIKQEEYFEKEVANGENIDSYYIVKPKDFIYNPRISESAPYGPIRTNETGEIGIVSPLYFVFGITDQASVDYDFLKYYFASSNWHRHVYSIGNNGARSDRMNVADTDFMNMPIKLPPLAEQKRIAEILGCCDRVIALKKELIAEKKKQKKALMQKLFNPNSGFRLPGFAGKWRENTLGEIGTFSKGKGIQNSQCQKTGFPCVKYGDIYMKYNVSFDVAESFTTSDVFNDSLQVTSGVLLFTCSGEDSREIGKCTLYTGGSPIAVGGDIIVMYPHESIAPAFLAYQQYSDSLIRQKNAFGKGNSIVHIHLPEISSLKISLPPTRQEQQAIADILSAADKEIDLLEQELVQQQQQKKSLMQLLLTGIVRV